MATVSDFWKRHNLSKTFEVPTRDQTPQYIYMGGVFGEQNTLVFRVRHDPLDGITEAMMNLTQSVDATTQTINQAAQVMAISRNLAAKETLNG